MELLGDFLVAEPRARATSTSRSRGVKRARATRALWCCARRSSARRSKAPVPGFYHWLAGTETTDGSDNLGEGCALLHDAGRPRCYCLAQLISIGGGREDKHLHQWARMAKIVDQRGAMPIRQLQTR